MKPLDENQKRNIDMLLFTDKNRSPIVYIKVLLLFYFLVGCLLAWFVDRSVSQSFGLLAS